MARKITSLVLFSNDKEISSSVQQALSSIDGLKVAAEDTSVSEINGKAVQMASDNDIVIFATDPENKTDVSTIKSLDAKRSKDTVFLALTDSSITLASARALTDAGVDDVLPYPVSDEELVRQIDRWIKKRAAAISKPGDREGAIIAVCQARGGIGSTTVAVNLADHLLVRKSRFRKEPTNSVTLVDLDLQFGSVGDFLELEPQDAMFQMAAGGVIPDAMWVDQSATTLDSGMHVIAAPYDFVPLDAVSDMQIRELVDILRAQNDYVVIDLPRAMVPWIQPVMDVADKLIMVTDTTVPSVRAAKRLIDFYTGENPGLAVDVVINHEKKPLVQGQHHKEAAKALETKFEHWLPHDPKAARSSVDYGQPLSQVAPRSDLNKAFQSLAKATTTALPMAQVAAK